MNTVIASGKATVEGLRTPRLKIFGWLLRRELWEHRGVWIAPASCALIVLCGAVFGQFDFGHASLEHGAMGAGKAAARSLTPSSEVALVALLGIATPFYFVLLFTQFFYALSSLYADRRDRSLLFWKSLPVSDLETVLSKLVMAMLVLPLVAAGFAVATQLAVALVGALRVDTLAAQLTVHSSLPAAQLAQQLLAVLADPRLWLSTLLLMVLVTVAFALWTLPLVGWGLLVSAAAPRSPVVFAILIPAGVSLAEGLLLQSHWLSSHLAAHAWGALGGLADALRANAQEGELLPGASTLWSAVTQGARLFSGAELWLGVLIGLLLTALAVWARRYRDENT
jgi:ABC-2 type transport system permease protein